MRSPASHLRRSEKGNDGFYPRLLAGFQALSAAELVSLMRARKLSPFAVVPALLDRIADINLTLIAGPHLLQVEAET